MPGCSCSCDSSIGQLSRSYWTARTTGWQAKSSLLGTVGLLPACVCHRPTRVFHLPTVAIAAKPMQVTVVLHLDLNCHPALSTEFHAARHSHAYCWTVCSTASRPTSGVLLQSASQCRYASGRTQQQRALSRCCVHDLLQAQSRLLEATVEDTAMPLFR